MANHRLVRRLMHAWFLMRRPMTLGVRILVEDADGQVLLVRHGYVDGWYLPGGGVETGETQQQAAEKELLEETGIANSEPMALIGVYWNRNASNRDHVTLFHCRSWERRKAFVPNREIRQARFFARDALPADVTAATRRRIAELYDDAPRSAYW